MKKARTARNGKNTNQMSMKDSVKYGLMTSSPTWHTSIRSQSLQSTSTDDEYDVIKRPAVAAQVRTVQSPTNTVLRIIR